MADPRPTGSECEHQHTERVPALYVDGRPLHRCLDCDGRFIYEDEPMSFKGLAHLKATRGGTP